MTDLHICDIFHTLQGEGENAGRRSLFVRMPYCNLACSWCDTQFNSYKKMSAGDLRDFALKEKCRFAVITGGEPMMHKHTPRVVNILKDLGFEIACETNGTFPIVANIDFVTCSPKRFQPNPYFVHPDAWDRVHEFKYVVDKEFDFNVLKRHDPGARSYIRHTLSPEWTDFAENSARIIDFIKENPRWRMSVQTHKFLGLQ